MNFYTNGTPYIFLFAYNMKTIKFPKLHVVHSCIPHNIIIHILYNMIFIIIFNSCFAQVYSNKVTSA